MTTGPDRGAKPVSGIDRKAATAAYKEARKRVGVYAIRESGGETGRQSGNGDVWVGSSPDLDKIANRQFFTLRLGTHPCGTLQAAWNAAGEAAFAFEVLEELAEDISDFARPRALKDRVAAWREELNAKAI